MKRYGLTLSLVLAVLLIASGVSPFAVKRAAAQTDPNLIALNDATPGIDVVITFPPDTTGAVALELSGAAVTVTDSAGNTVFLMADARVHALELHFAPNATPHTLSVVRLAGITEGYVKVTSQNDLTTDTGLVLIDGEMVAPGQELDTFLDATTPNSAVSVSLPTDGSTSTITASFPGAPVTAQLVDNAGVAVATVYAGSIDGLRLALDGGDYQMIMVNTNPNQHTLAAVSAVPSNPSTLPVAVATSTNTTTVAQTVPDQSTGQAAASVGACTLTIDVSSANLRSGPGTGYSILDYGFRNETYAVGGTNTEQNWLLIGLANGSAWVDRTLGTVSGGCNALTVYNIPLRMASSVPQIALQPASGSAYHDDDDDENESEEHEEGDHDDEGDDD